MLPSICIYAMCKYEYRLLFTRQAIERELAKFDEHRSTSGGNAEPNLCAKERKVRIPRGRRGDTPLWAKAFVQRPAQGKNTDLLRTYFTSWAGKMIGKKKHQGTYIRVYKRVVRSSSCSQVIGRRLGLWGGKVGHGWEAATVLDK